MAKIEDFKLTIIVPVYNEEDNMAKLEEAFSAFLKHSLMKACVLFVNDGSADHSEDLIHKICDRNEDFFYISFASNTGLSAAIYAGITVCKSEYVGYIDADLQTSPEDFNLLMPYCAYYELVTGIRTNRKDTFFKRIQSKIANSFRNLMTHDGVQDTGCPLKIMKTEYAKRVIWFKGMHRFLPALIQLQGGKVMQVPVRHFPRTAGKSKFHLSNRFWGPLRDCFVFRWMRRRYIRYSIKSTNLAEIGSNH